MRRMTHFSAYLSERGIRQSDFAARIGATQGTISRLANGLVLPSLELAVIIERETSGRVKATDWIEQHTGDAA